MQYIIVTDDKKNTPCTYETNIPWPPVLCFAYFDTATRFNTEKMAKEAIAKTNHALPVKVVSI